MSMFTAEQIKDLRLRLGMNLEQFANEFGVSEAAVRRWELGERHPKFATVLKMNQLAEGLKLKPRKQLASA